MPAIQRRTVEVFYAPTKRRRFFTARSAADAEARAKLELKYPSESPEYGDYGQMHYPGWNWREDEHMVRVHKRYMRLLLRALKGEQG